MKIQFSELEWKLHQEILVYIYKILVLFNFAHELKPDQLLPSNLLKTKFPSFNQILKFWLILRIGSYSNGLNNWNIYMQIIGSFVLLKVVERVSESERKKKKEILNSVVRKTCVSIYAFSIGACKTNNVLQGFDLVQVIW